MYAESTQSQPSVDGSDRNTLLLLPPLRRLCVCRRLSVCVFVCQQELEKELHGFGLNFFGQCGYQKKSEIFTGPVTVYCLDGGLRSPGAFLGRKEHLQLKSGLSDSPMSRPMSKSGYKKCQAVSVVALYFTSHMCYKGTYFLHTIMVPSAQLFYGYLPLGLH